MSKCFAGTVHSLPNCVNCPVRRVTVCAAFEAQGWYPSMAARSAIKRLSPRAEIYRQGQVLEDCFIVVTGWVALEMTLEDASRHIFDFALPGDILGSWPGRGVTSSHSAECLTDTTICVMPQAKLAQLAEGNRPMLVKLEEMLRIRLERAHDHILNIACRPARNRLAHLLVSLFHRVHGQLPARGDRIALPLSQTQLADALAITHVHTCRLLGKFREDGILRFSGGVLEIYDGEALLREADFEPQSPPSVPQASRTGGRSAAPPVPAVPAGTLNTAS